ncbi:MAG: UvrD-helicase domain-containing protein [Planctomycetota bacterium]
MSHSSLPLQIIDKLTPSQRKAVCHIQGPLLVLAGPGSGKTRVITNRIAALIYAGVSPCNICAITFTNRAADEMRRRVMDIGTAHGTHISTFHSLCVRILRTYGQYAGLNSSFSIYDESDQLRCAKEAIKRCDMDSASFTPAKMLAAISLLKNDLEDVDSVAERADDYFTKMLSRVYKQYQQVLAENNALDFDDLLCKTAWLMRDYPDVRSELGSRYRFLLIDEYQDTNHAQYQIAKGIALEHGNICVTGDPDQSIYRWRGADIANILIFEKDWPNATVVKLEENFRSAANILTLADKLIANNRKRKAKILIPTKPADAQIAVEGFTDEQQEVISVAERIKKLIGSASPANQIAVFYRVNSMSRGLEEVLIRSRIPYRIVRGIEFYNRKEIRDCIAYLKVIANPADTISLIRIINSPARGIGKRTLERLSAFAHADHLTLYQALSKARQIESLSSAVQSKVAAFVHMMEHFKQDSTGKVAPLIEKIFTESGLHSAFIAEDSGQESALENVNELINGATLYDSSTENPSLLDYLQQIALYSDSDAYDPQSDAVALMTLHAAKGLEFDNVFIIGLEEGLLPHQRSSGNNDELEEERRLFFVGITRARKNLYISYCQYRTMRGALTRTIPSQFLYELGYDLDSQIQNHEHHYEYDTSSSQIPVSVNDSPFKKYDVVLHNCFGVGTVRSFTDMGENSTVTVRFNSGKTKTLMLKYAGLAKITTDD